MSSSIGIEKDFFYSIIRRDMDDLVRYQFGTISKSFYSVLSLGLFISFPRPSRLIHIKKKERRERKDKNTEGGAEAHSNGQVDSYRLVDMNRLSSVVKVQLWFVAKDRRDIWDKPANGNAEREEMGHLHL